MDDIEGQKLVRENDYLKLRCAQLQDDVTNLSSQVNRLQQELERVRGRGDAHAAAQGGEGA